MTDHRSADDGERRGAVLGFRYPSGSDDPAGSGEPALIDDGEQRDLIEEIEFEKLRRGQRVAERGEVGDDRARETTRFPPSPACAMVDTFSDGIKPPPRARCR